MSWSPEAYRQALLFAAEQHRGQLMPGGELPYVVHLTLVAMEVIGALGREAVGRPDLALQCALLHDTIEDTEATREAVAARFGPAVGAGVAALSKDGDLPKAEQMADSLTRVRQQPREVWMVKLADRITNLASPPAPWSAAKRRRYQTEAGEIHEALAEASPYLSARLLRRIDAYSAHLEPKSG